MISLIVRNPILVLLCASLTALGLIAAQPGTHDKKNLTHSHSSSQAKEIDGRKVSGSLTIHKNGTVINKAYVKGTIAVKADNVTIKNTIVDSHSYHSVRIYPGAKGTKIVNTTVMCGTSHTNGIVFGNYTAKKVKLNGCRNNFMTTSGPAKVVHSWIDGVPFHLSRKAKTGGASRATKPSKPQSNESAESRPTKSSPSKATKSPAATKSPTASTSPSVPAGGWPNASNTGVPAGKRLKSSDGMTITKPGTVIDGRRIHGVVKISADNVTIRNSIVETKTPMYPIQVTSGVKGALIDHVEVDNMNGTGLGIFFQGGSGTVRAANIHSAEDGIRVQADNVTIEDSYIHDLFRQPGGHHDTIQIRRGDNVTIKGNNLEPYKQSTDDPMNSAIQIGSLLGSDKISNLRVVGNLMDGGNFTINGGGRGEVDSALYSGNEFGRDYRFAISGNIQNSTWASSNVWADTGLPAR